MNIELEPMDFLTIMQRDYTPKTIKNQKRYIQEQECKDPIAEPFKRFLALKEFDPEDGPPMQKLDEYFENFQKLYPDICKLHLKSPVDKHVIEIDNIKKNRTVYQNDYCDLDRQRKYVEEELAKKNFRLPENWPIPSTTYLASYRKKKFPFKAHKVYPVHNITINENETKSFKTGLTEYQRTVGRIGEEIMECQIYGKKVYRPCSTCK